MFFKCKIKIIFLVVSNIKKRLSMTDIQILARVKPHFKKSEGASCIDIYDNIIEVNKNQSAYCGKYKVKHNYKFDSVMDETFTNIEIYNRFSIDILKTLIQKKRDVTFYMYGQTGSGKTHTILGNNNENGFLYLLLNDVLDIRYKMSVSVVEIYNNKCFDILNQKKQIFQREDFSNKFKMSSSKIKKIENSKDINDIKNIINKCRVVGVSSENDRSSRSHLQISVFINDNVFRLLDLAGCEKAKDAKYTTKKEFLECGEINQSLFALKECIRSMVENKPHVPFRRCELTKMLRHSFQPECKTYIMSTISQDSYNSVTTSDVLNYVCEMKNIKRTISRKLESVKNRPIPRPPKMTNIDLLNMTGSPRFKNIVSKKKKLNKLNDMEEKILEKMMKKKSTEGTYQDYIRILNDKKRILESYFPKPPAPPPK